MAVGAGTGLPPCRRPRMWVAVELGRRGRCLGFSVATYTGGWGSWRRPGRGTSRLWRSPQSGPVLIRPSSGSASLGPKEERSVPVLRWAGPRHTWAPYLPWEP